MKISKLLTTVLFFSVVINACKSAPKGPEFYPTEVIERIAGFDATPKWANGSSSLLEESGKVIVVQNRSFRENDGRTDACIRAVEELGRASLMKYIKDGISSSGQVSELDSNSDPAIEALTAFLSQGSLSGATVIDRYWERRVVSTGTGERVMELYCAAKIGIQKTTLDRQLKEAVSGAKGNPEIREKLLEAQKNFIDNIGNNKE